MNNDRPPTLSETELYRLLERANLLIYYPAFISKGGDDVQQLYEASEQEFTEITSLVGMSGKPLHIRRLQKALSEWQNNPSDFHQPLPPGLNLSSTIMKANYARQNQSLKSDTDENIRNEMPQWPTSSAIMQKLDNYSQPVFPGHYQPLNSTQISPSTQANNSFINQPQQNEFPNPLQQFAFSKPAFFQIHSQAITSKLSTPGTSNSNFLSVDCTQESPINTNTRAKPIKSSLRGIPVSLLPNAVLRPSDEIRIEACAKEIIRLMPDYPIKRQTKDTKLSQSILDVILMPLGHPNRDTEIRRYSAIYGRFDTPRKTGRPMSYHEVAVNEASFRLSRCMPNLLTRREDLYPIARQIVKLSEVTVKLGLFNQVVPLTSTDEAVSLLNKHFLSESKTFQTGGPFPAEILRDANLSELASIQNRLSTIKSDLNLMIEEQNSLRISFRAAKASFASIAVAEVQKQITALGGNQQKKLEEMGNLIVRQKQLLNILTSESYDSKEILFTSLATGKTEYCIKREEAVNFSDDQSHESIDSKSISSSLISFPPQNSTDIHMPIDQANILKESLSSPNQSDSKSLECNRNNSSLPDHGDYNNHNSLNNQTSSLDSSPLETAKSQMSAGSSYATLVDINSGENNTSGIFSYSNNVNSGDRNNVSIPTSGFSLQNNNSRSNYF